MKKRITSLFIAVIMIASLIPTLVVNAAAIKGWSVSYSGGCKGSADIDYNLGSNSQQSLKLVCESDVMSNVYMLLTTYVPVQEGRTYVYGGDVKSDNSSTVQTMINWGTRTNLLLYGKTFDFHSYKFKYAAEKTGRVQLMFLIEGKTDGVWLDNMYFMDEEEGVNLISNSDFEEVEEEEKVEVGENEYQQTVLDINRSTEYAVSDLEKSSSLFNSLPVFYKDDITIDADASDWEDTTMAYMPISTYKQLQTYAHDDEREKDLKVDYAFAYDEEYLYMYYNVYDDLIETFADLPNYWRGDSIQFMLSEKGETTGYEYGLIHDKKTDSGMIFSSVSGEAELSKCIVSTKRVGNYTTYEAAIPWKLKYPGRPDEILFDFIVNDNDFAGRAYCIQLAPGIAEGKTNEQYPAFVMIDKEQDWFAFVDGEKVPNIDEETVYNLYISNYGEDKTFTVKANGEEKEVTVKSGRGYRESIPVTFTEEKEEVVTAQVVYEGKTYELVHGVTAKRKKPTTKVAKAYQREVAAFAEEIESLIGQCNEKGISTDYEEVHLQTLKFFAGFMTEDIDADQLERINYTYGQLIDIYNEAKENLEAYLSGAKTSLVVPEYINNSFKINGTTTYADTFDGENYENRPVFFVGYGHFYYALSNMSKIAKLGANSIQMETGPRSVLRVPGQFISGSFSLTNNPEATIELQSDVVRSGENALKFVYKTPKQNNVVAIYKHSMSVKPNKKYVGSMWIKGKNSKGVTYGTDGWNERIDAQITEEWKEYEISFTANDEQYQRSLSIFIDDICDELYIDDISVKDAETGEEVYFNGGFEERIKDGEKFAYNETALYEIYELLQKGEALNMSVDVLLSPHYMHSYLYEVAPEAKAVGGGFMGFDPNHPVAREIIESYLRYVIPRIAEYKALNSICIANEPTFRANGFTTYDDEWHDFLKEKHGDIETLNYKYGTEYSSFDEIPLPTELGANDPSSVDYHEFNDIQFSSWHIWMADIIREIAPEIPVHFKVMPYVNSYEEGHARENMTHGYSLEYTADAFALNGCDSVNFITDGAGNKIQTMWYDFQVSINEAPVFDTEHHVMPDGSDKIYSDEYDAYASANVWQGALHYRANSVLWAWERTQDKNSSYWGLMTQRPKSVWGIAIAAKDLNRLAYQIEAFQNEDAEVAILYSPASRMYGMTKLNMMYETYNALVCIGKKVKFVTEMQAEKMYNHDVLIVPGSDHVKDNTFDMITDYIKKGGKVVLIGDECLKYTEYNKERDAEKRQFILDNSTVYPNIESSGKMLTSVTTGEYKELLRDYLKKEGKIWVEVLNAETGKICEDLEYNLAVCDEKLLVNICNYGDTTDVSVFVNGEKVTESSELRSMTEQGEVVTAKQYEPILLEIETKCSFMDTYGHWAEDNVLDAYNKNLVSGVNNSRFEPDSKITRAQFITMLVRAAELRPETYTNVFSDVSSDAWYAPYIQSAYNAGIIRGEFARPEDYITREEMSNFTVSAYELKKEAQVSFVTFNDADEISDLAAVSKAYATGLISGYEDNFFRPKNNLTRAEAVTVILNLYNRIG